MVLPGPRWCSLACCGAPWPSVVLPDLMWCSLTLQILFQCWRSAIGHCVLFPTGNPEDQLLRVVHTGGGDDWGQVEDTPSSPNPVKSPPPTSTLPPLLTQFLNFFILDSRGGFMRLGIPQGRGRSFCYLLTCIPTHGSIDF